MILDCVPRCLGGGQHDSNNSVRDARRARIARGDAAAMRAPYARV